MHNYKQVESKIIIFNTPKLKFADLGYMRHTDKSIELELFVAGEVIQRIHIDNLICVDEGCMRKSSFNEEYLSSKYPDNLFRNILLGNAIYEGKNLLYMNGGFEQVIETQDVDIKYKVNGQGVYFKDRKNSVLMKIKDIK